jgi:hypothetical protein
VIVLRKVLATVAIKDSVVAAAIVPTGCIGWPRRSAHTVPSGVQHQLDDIALFEQRAKRAELPAHAFGETVPCSARKEALAGSPIPPP